MYSTVSNIFKIFSLATELLFQKNVQFENPSAQSDALENIWKEKHLR